MSAYCPSRAETGPVPPNIFVLAVSLPAGEALKLLRRFDPDFGVDPDALEPRRWRLAARGRAIMRGVAYVEARTRSEALALAETVYFDWDDADDPDLIDDVEAHPIEPDKPWRPAPIVEAPPLLALMISEITP